MIEELKKQLQLQVSQAMGQAGSPVSFISNFKDAQKIGMSALIAQKQALENNAFLSRQKLLETQRRYGITGAVAAAQLQAHNLQQRATIAQETNNLEAQWFRAYGDSGLNSPGMIEKISNESNLAYQNAIKQMYLGQFNTIAYEGLKAGAGSNASEIYGATDKLVDLYKQYKGTPEFNAAIEDTYNSFTFSKTGSTTTGEVKADAPITDVTAPGYLEQQRIAAEEAKAAEEERIRLAQEEERNSSEMIAPYYPSGGGWWNGVK